MHNEPFTQAAQQWDLQTLYADLTFAKGKPVKVTSPILNSLPFLSLTAIA